MVQNRPFYGWKLLSALAAIVAINQGITYVGASVINASMAKDLGLSRATLGLGSTVFLLCLGLSAPFVAWTVNSFGARATMCISSLLIALGSILLATSVSRGWQFVLCYGLFLGTGDIFGGMIPAQSCATLWFEKRRAMTFALVLIGASLGAAIGAPLFTFVIAHAHGNWRLGWFCIVVASLSATLISILFVKNRPEDLGQVTDGDAEPRTRIFNDRAPSRSPIYRTRYHWTLKQAMRTPVFWLLTFAAVGESAPGTAAVAHAVPHLRQLGHTAAAAGSALSSFAICSIAGKLIVGFLCDRFDPRSTWAVSIIFIGSGVFIAIYAQSEAAMYLFMGLSGLGAGAAMTCWHATIANYFGPISFPAILCTQLAISSIFSAASPLFAGMIYDLRGSYASAFFVLAAFSISTAILLLFAKPPKQPSLTQANP